MRTCHTTLLLKSVLFMHALYTENGDCCRGFDRWMIDGATQLLSDLLRATIWSINHDYLLPLKRRHDFGSALIVLPKLPIIYLPPPRPYHHILSYPPLYELYETVPTTKPAALSIIRF